MATRNDEMNRKIYHEWFYSEAHKYAAPAVTRLDHELRPPSQDRAGKLVNVSSGFGVAFVTRRKNGLQNIEGMEKRSEQATVTRNGPDLRAGAGLTDLPVLGHDCSLTILNEPEHAPVSVKQGLEAVGVRGD